MLIGSIDKAFIRLRENEGNLVLLDVGDGFVVDDRLVELPVD
jgi:hypothetical protein